MHTLKVLVVYGLVVFVRAFASMLAIAAIVGAIGGIFYLVARKLDKQVGTTTS